MHRRQLLYLPLFAAAGPIGAHAGATPSRTDRRFEDIAARYFEDRMDLDPMTASSLLAAPKYEGRFNVTIAPDEVAKAPALDRRVKRELLGVPRGDLSEANRLNRDLLDDEVTLSLQGSAFPAHLMPIDQFGAIPVLMATLGSGEQLQPLKTPTDYDNLHQRLARLPDWNTQAMANMREGMRLGYTQPRAVIAAALPMFRALTEPDFEKSDFSGALKVFPASFSADERARIGTAYRELFQRALLPAMTALVNFLQDTYLPACRTSAGYDALPNGAAFYRHLVRFHTSSRMTPDQIHALGLAEVKRIRAEMAKVQARFGFEGGVSDFLKWHAEHPRFRPFKTPEDVVAAFVALDQRVAPQLAKLFGRRPRHALEIREVPELLRASGGAYYNPPAPDGSRPGIFFVWSPDPAKFNDSIVSSLLLHEARPGHHFHASLQLDMDLPNFRKFGWNTAFIEGWGLYAETLGHDLGLYDDPNQHLGHLKLDLFRAVRLVTDTGLHARGWTRERSIDYMMQTEGASESNARNATERYMAVPGQALAYKIGQLKFSELRARAQRALKQSFSLRDFHDLMLSQGTVPLHILDRLTDEWITRVKRNTGAA